jgi:hypothetical protein
MGIAQMAVMPLQALVDFFAPNPHSHTGQTKPTEANSVYWARERLAQRNANQAALSAAARPVQRGASRMAPRLSRTGFAVGAGTSEASCSSSAVRMRRSSDATQTPGNPLAGRMVIAGRMRDVCAALDGMAD